MEQASKQTNKQTDEDRTTDIRQTNKETNVYWECISAKNYFYYSQKPCRNPSRCFEQKNSLIMYGWSVRALTGSAAHSSVMIWHLKKQPYPNFQAVAKSKPRPPESPPARRCTGQQPHARARTQPNNEICIKQCQLHASTTTNYYVYYRKLN